MTEPTEPDWKKPFLHCPVCDRLVKPTWAGAGARQYRCASGHETDHPVVRYFGDPPFMSYPTEIPG